MFNKLVILDRIILTEEQWSTLRGLAREVVEFSGLRPKEIIEQLARDQDIDPGAVCFTALAIEQQTMEVLSGRLAGADAAVTCWTSIPDEVLRANPQLHYIGFWTNLAAHRINLELAAQHGIKVTWIPDYGTEAVAEFTIAAMLQLARRQGYQAHQTLRGSWVYEQIKTAMYLPSPEGIPFFNLTGKKLGIIGFGQIGQRVAELALAFGMQVVYHTRRRRPEWEKRGVLYLEMDELLRDTDIATLHLSPYAYLDDVHQVSLDYHAPDWQEKRPVHDQPVITRERLALLQDGTIFINTAAGRLVDEEAMLEEAESGRIRIAADVWQSNPDRRRLKKIVERFGQDYHLFTYRGGWYTRDAVTFKGDELIRQLREALD